jgi:methionyl-tRNA formyltransferase
MPVAAHLGPRRIPYGESVARLAFLGTPEMAVPPLRALVAAGHDVALCVTRPDRRRGRGARTTPSPVKEAATELGLPVSHDMDDVAEAGVELAVVVAFGRIIPPHLLRQVPMVNLHFSLLPRWRGAAPVERAILAGDRETGVCLMKVEEGLDTGPVYGTGRVPIGDRLTLDALRAELVAVGSALLVDALRDGVGGLPAPEPQHGEVTLAEKLTAEDLHLRWSEPALQLARVVRLQRAWTTFRGRRLTVLDAEVSAGSDAGAGQPGDLRGDEVVTGHGSLRLLRVQPESRSPMSAEDWLRGVRPRAGERLGTD